MNYLKLTHEKLNLEAIQDLVLDESCGAVSIFAGVTRDNFENKKVIKLEYEAYDTMAIKAITKICDEMRVKWSEIKHIAIYHRLGIVPVKESSVIIAISSPHRNASLEAVQFAIDALKKSVPIWKKELYDEEQACSSQAKTNGIPAKPQRKKFKSTCGINFDACCPVKNDSVIPKELQQINANEMEIQRRINCFVDRKREEINMNNIQNYLSDSNRNNAAEQDMSCSRVSSSAFSTRGMSGHLKIHRVKNEIGPQMTNYTDALAKLTNNTKLEIKSDLDAHGIEERINNLEKTLRIPTAEMPTIFNRIKNIEDRVLHLETTSPEYRHFINLCYDTKKTKTGATTMKLDKSPYSVADINELLEKFEEEN